MSYNTILAILQITVCGNAFCLHLLGFYALHFCDKRTNQNIILFSLSIVEITISITGTMFTIEFLILKDFLGPIGYKILICIENIAIYQLILVMYILTIDRFVCIRSPWTYQSRMTRKRVFLLILLSWVISIVIGVIGATLGMSVRKWVNLSITCIGALYILFVAIT